MQRARRDSREAACRLIGNDHRPSDAGEVRRGHPAQGRAQSAPAILNGWRNREHLPEPLRVAVFDSAQRRSEDLARSGIFQQLLAELQPVSPASATPSRCALIRSLMPAEVRQADVRRRQQDRASAYASARPPRRAARTTHALIRLSMTAMLPLSTNARLVVAVEGRASGYWSSGDCSSSSSGPSARTR